MWVPIIPGARVKVNSSCSSTCQPIISSQLLPLPDMCPPYLRIAVLAHYCRDHIFFPLLMCYALQICQGIHFLLSHTVIDMKHPPPSRMLCNCPPNIVSFGYLPTLLLQHPGQASVVPMRYNRLRDFQGRDYGLSTISSTTWWFLACMVDNKCFWNE